MAKPAVWAKSGVIFLMICFNREDWADSADWGINSGDRRKGSEASSHCSWHSWIRRCHQQPGLVCFCYVVFVVVGELEQLETCAAWSPILPTCPRCTFFFQVLSQAPYFLPLLPLHSPCLLLCVYASVMCRYVCLLVGRPTVNVGSLSRIRFLLIVLA